MKQEARILIADDDTQMQIALVASLERAGYHVTAVSDGRSALERAEHEAFDLIITDQCMPEMTGQELMQGLSRLEIQVPVVMITAYGTVTQAVEAMQAGAADFIAKPFSVEELLRIVERCLSTDTQVFRTEEKKKGASGRPIITRDPVMIRVLEVAEAVARSEATVLIQGESGTGKELIARLLHSASPRAQQPFVAVNCAALPENLLESELFGHEKGAFTGAQQRKIGKFELAHGGTILLDEISEMDLLLQAKLLRVLQEREVDRVGGREPIAIDVRVVATTNRNLESCVAEGKFRADLYYRLNVIPVTVPPLRQRRGDVPLLVQHFMHKYLGDDAPSLSAEATAALEAHPWPGNIRELQNAVERAAILSRGQAPRTADFMLGATAGLEVTSQGGRIVTNAQSDAETVPSVVAVSPGIQLAPREEDSTLRIRSGMSVAEVERSLIFETLKATHHNRTQAAKLLGISIRTLRNKLHEYGAIGAED